MKSGCIYRRCDISACGNRSFRAVESVTSVARTAGYVGKVWCCKVNSARCARRAAAAKSR